MFKLFSQNLSQKQELKKLFILIYIAIYSLLTVFTSFVNIQAQDQTLNLWEVIEADSRLTTLAEGLKSANFEDTLRGNNHFTIFAPTNDAFDSFSSLSEPTDPEFVDMISYHIVSGKISTNQLESIKELETLQGKNLQISNLVINDANITQKNIEAENGYIHIISKVLETPEDDKSGIFQTKDLPNNAATSNLNNSTSVASQPTNTQTLNKDAKKDVKSVTAKNTARTGAKETSLILAILSPFLLIAFWLSIPAKRGNR